MRIKTIMVIATLLLAVACTGKKKEQADKQPVEKPVEVTESLGETDHALHFLVEAKDSYPNQTGLLQNEELKSRIQFLMKQEADSLYRYWNVETPIQIQENVVFTSGCEQHNCPAHSYVLVVHLVANSINVYQFKQDQLVIYTEETLLDLPKALADEMSIIKSNANVSKNSTRIVSLSTK